MRSNQSVMRKQRTAACREYTNNANVARSYKDGFTWPMKRAIVATAITLAITGALFAQDAPPPDAANHYANSMIVPDSLMPPEAEPSRWLPITRGAVTIAPPPIGRTSAFMATTMEFPNPNPRPSLPEWTRCSTSWSQNIAAGESGEQIWVFATTLSDDDVQDFATSLRWYNDIEQRHPEVKRNYMWLPCNAAFVHDWMKNHSTIPPADHAGSIGYDSPLGTCHRVTPTQRRYGARCSGVSAELGCSGPGALATIGALDGVLGDDNKIHGWVRGTDGHMYLGSITDTACVNGCEVAYDSPCSLPNPLVQPFAYRRKDGGEFFTWWWGGDPSKPSPWEVP